MEGRREGEREGGEKDRRREGEERGREERREGEKEGEVELKKGKKKYTCDKNSQFVFPGVKSYILLQQLIKIFKLAFSNCSNIL